MIDFALHVQALSYLGEQLRVRKDINLRFVKNFEVDVEEEDVEDDGNGDLEPIFKNFFLSIIYEFSQLILHQSLTKKV